MSARDVIADWLSEASITNGFENSRGMSTNDHADAALAAAGFSVIDTALLKQAEAILLWLHRSSIR